MKDCKVVFIQEGILKVFLTWPRRFSPNSRSLATFHHCVRVKTAVLKNVGQLKCAIYLSESLSIVIYVLIVIKMMSDIVNFSVNSLRHLVKRGEANICPGLRVSSKEGPIGWKMREVSFKNLPIGKGSASVTQPPADHQQAGEPG